jgi:hypothetical protein
VANKSWEAAPLVSVLSHPDARPRRVDRVVAERSAGQERTSPRPRLRCGPAVVKIYCLQDAMDAGTSVPNAMAQHLAAASNAAVALAWFLPGLADALD